MATNHQLVFEGGGLLAPPPPPPPFKMSTFARFERWWSFASNSTSHHPPIRANVVVFEGGSLPPPPPFKTRKTGSFSRVMVVCHPSYLQPPSNTSKHARFRGWQFVTFTTLQNERNALVFEGDGGLPPLLPPTTLRNEQTRSFSKVFN